MKTLSLTVFSLLLLSGFAQEASAYSKAAACTYTADPKDIQLVWTAFKFTTKAGVKGHFNKAQVSGAPSAKSLAGLMQNLQMEIDAASVDTDNPGRNATIQQFFFEKFAPASKIHAATSKVVGDDAKGTATIKITMNGVTRAVPFAYTATPEGILEAKASIDLLNFKLQSAFDSIHEACKDKHTGPDGVSKTWTQVDLALTGKFKKECP
ncbi:MAG: YceI family protein [Deltaproteobacteria bacterium]|nr:YceI family protein [Deltaproteobacteria bacterium]